MLARLSALLGLAVVVGGLAPARAADLYSGPGGRYAPAPMTSHMAWYVRGDFGYATHDDPTINEAGLYDLNDTSLDDTWTGGLGIGRYFSSRVRGDITWDFRFEADVAGSTIAGPYPGERRFGLTSNVILANLYYDFDRGNRFTPYLGVGLGTVHHKTLSGIVIPTPCACAADIADASDWSVAGAFMAGFAINFGSRATYGGSIKDAPVESDARGRWHLDAGYRLLYLGEARTGSITASSGVGPTVDGDRIEDIIAHEFRVGLRYDIR
jgi:opacity protein-like surface antigen